MNRWEIWNEDGTREEIETDNITEYLQKKYPGKHIEEFTDQAFVFNKPEDYPDVDPIATANAI